MSLDEFRTSLISSSIASAGQRMTKQRRHFASADAAKSYARLAAEHAAVTVGQLDNFGCIASVATPALIRLPPEDEASLRNAAIPKVPVRESNPRVSCACAIPGPAASSSTRRDELVAMGLNDGTVTVWDATDGSWKVNATEPLPAQKIDGSVVAGIAARGGGATAAAADGATATVVSAHRNGCLAFWKMPNNSTTTTAATSSSTSSSKDDAGTRSASATAVSSGPASIIHPSLIVENAHGNKVPLRQCCWSSACGGALATTGEDGTVKIWQVVDKNNSISAECLISLENGHDPVPTASATTAAADQQQQPSAVSAAAATAAKDHPMPGTRCVAFHPDGALLLAGDESGALALWDLRDCTRIWSSVGTRPLHSGRVNAVAFSPNGFNFFSGGDDGLLYCFDLRKLAPPSAAAAVTGTNAAASALNSTVFSYSWRVAAHSDAVTDITLGPTTFFLGGDFPDAAFLFTGGLDGSAAAFDAWTGEELWRSIPLPTHVAGPSVGVFQAPPSVRAVCCVVHETSEEGKQQQQQHQRATQFNLVVMAREPQWRSYCPGGALVDAVRQVGGAATTVGADGAVEQQQQSTAASAVEHKQQQHIVQQDNAGDDDDSSDDDVLGQLRK